MSLERHKPRGEDSNEAIYSSTNRPVYVLINVPSLRALILSLRRFVRPTVCEAKRKKKETKIEAS